MKIQRRHIIAVILGILVLVIDFYLFRATIWFYPLLVIALTIAWIQFWIDFFINRRIQRNLETTFPDYVRNLVGAIRSGMPVAEAIVHVARTDYGYLTPYVKKLANQIEWSIPIRKAFQTFARDTNNEVIKRAVATVIEAEQAGGNIEDVLETVTTSVIEIREIKQKRRASIHSQVLQSYVIFFVFLAVMVTIQNLVIPYVVSMEEASIAEGTALVRTGVATLAEKVEMDYSSFPAFISTFQDWLVSIRGVLLNLAIIQGFFAGIVIGKLSEGDVVSGLKHSLVLMTIAAIILTLFQAL